MTTPPSRHPTTAHPGLWCVSLFLVLAGLFGMHGLASHGSCDMPATAGTTTAMMAVPDATNGTAMVAEARDDAHRMTTAVSAGARVLEAAVQVTNAGSGPQHGVVGLCLAVIAAALIALLLARRPARGITVAVHHWQVRQCGRGRDRDPPSLTQLSVRRC